MFTSDELNRIRQMIDAVEDLNPAYLEPEDFKLRDKVIQLIEQGKKPQNVEIPAVGSVWRNKKKQTLYKVWAIAEDANTGDLFVIYQNAETSIWQHQCFVVRHSETDRSGIFRSPSQDKTMATIHWEKEFTTSWDENSFNVFAAWARPIEMWHEKFERRSAPEYPPATPYEQRTRAF